MTLKEVTETLSIGPLYATQDSLILYIEPNRFSEDFKTEANKLGVHLRESALANSGPWSGIYRDIESGELIGTEVSVK